MSYYFDELRTVTADSITLYTQNVNTGASVTISDAQFAQLDGINTALTIQQQINAISTTAGVGIGPVTTTTLAPGNNANVTVVADPSSTPALTVIDFNFYIPQGAIGATGATGATGAQGATGATPNITIGTVDTNTLAAGASATANVTLDIISSPTNPVFDFTFGIPTGDVGPTPDITVGSVQTETLNPGSDATAQVTLDPTSTLDTPIFDFNFGIPQGKHDINKNSQFSCKMLNIFFRRARCTR